MRTRQFHTDQKKRRYGLEGRPIPMMARTHTRWSEYLQAQQQVEDDDPEQEGKPVIDLYAVDVLLENFEEWLQANVDE